MATITGWVTDQPSQDTLASSVDDTLRLSLATLATGIGGAMYWPGSASSQGASTASSGEFLLGTARVGEIAAEAGANSISSDGFLSMKTSSLYTGLASLRHIGSTDTFLIGHPMAPEHNITPLLTSRWVQKSGTFSVSNDPTSPTLVEMAVTYGGTPTIIVSANNTPSGNSYIIGIVAAANSSNFSSMVSYIGPGAAPGANIDFEWMSIGTVTF